MEPTLDTLVTVCAAVFLFWRLHSSSESVRKELKDDILRVQKKNEGAYKELKSDIYRVEKKSEDAHKEIQLRLVSIEKEQAAHTERLNCIEKLLSVSGQASAD